MNLSLKTYLNLSCFLLGIIIFGQNIQGNVKNIYGDNLENVTVYIDGTTTKTITDSYGNFTIISNSAHANLVFNKKGYINLVVNVNSIKEDNPTFVLDELVELDEVIATAYSKKELDFFKILFIKNFIGESDFAKTCKIKNEKTLKFHYNQNERILTVSANEPLIIENRALGYSITYQLKSFILDTRQNQSFVAGYSYFEPHKLGFFRKNRVLKNRKTAYLGSLQHFISTLYNKEEKTSGYQIRRIVLKPNPNYPTEKKIQEAKENLALKENLILSHNDPDLDVLKRVREGKYIEVLYSQLLSREDFIKEKDSRVFIDFKDLLNVEYTKEKLPKSYIQSHRLDDKSKSLNQNSTMIIGQKIEIFKNGSFNPIDQITVKGYWSFEKVGDMMPLDFENK